MIKRTKDSYGVYLNTHTGNLLFVTENYYTKYLARSDELCIDVQEILNLPKEEWGVYKMLCPKFNPDNISKQVKGWECYSADLFYQCIPGTTLVKAKVKRNWDIKQ